MKKTFENFNENFVKIFVYNIIWFLWLKNEKNTNTSSETAVLLAERLEGLSSRDNDILSKKSK